MKNHRERVKYKVEIDFDTITTNGLWVNVFDEMLLEFLRSFNNAWTKKQSKVRVQVWRFDHDKNSEEVKLLAKSKTHTNNC